MSRPARILLSAFGEAKSISAWANDPRCSVSKAAISKRLRENWTAEDAISKPAADRKSKSRTADGRKKPTAPKDVPIKPHNCGQWYCSHPRTGKRIYLGTWDDLESARERYLALLQGKDKSAADKVPFGDLVNQYLADLDARRQTGEVSEQHFRDAKIAFKQAIEIVGRELPVDEEMLPDLRRYRTDILSKYAPTTGKNRLQKVRSVFQYGFRNRIIDLHPDFVKDVLAAPSKAVLRKHRASKPMKFIEADTIKQVLENCNSTYRAMILLGVNGGLTQADLAALPTSSVDLESGWIRFPRPKTGIERRFPLWQETSEAITEVLQDRPTPARPQYADLVFLTNTGNPYLRFSDGEKNAKVDSIRSRFDRLLKQVDAKERGVGFGSLRHITETIGGRTGDQAAVDQIMGHTEHGIAAHYREFTDDERLEAVTQVLHEWLFGDDEEVDP